MSASNTVKKTCRLHNTGHNLWKSSASTQGLTISTPSMAGYEIFLTLPFTCSMSVTTSNHHTAQQAICMPEIILWAFLHRLGILKYEILHLSSRVQYPNVIGRLSGRG